MRQPALDLDDIQGDILEGLQKSCENFVFFRLEHPTSFKHLARANSLGNITSAQLAHKQELAIEHRKRRGQKAYETFHGVNLGLTKDGLDRLLGSGRSKLGAALENGADHPDTIAGLRDPPKSRWLSKFSADRIDGVFLITGPDAASVRSIQMTCSDP